MIVGQTTFPGLVFEDLGYLRSYRTYRRTQIKASAFMIHPSVSARGLLHVPVIRRHLPTIIPTKKDQPLSY